MPNNSQQNINLGNISIHNTTSHLYKLYNLIYRRKMVKSEIGIKWKHLECFEYKRQ